MVSRLTVWFYGFTVGHCLVANRETAGSTVSRLTVGLAANCETVDPTVARLTVRFHGFTVDRTVLRFHGWARSGG